MSKGYREIVQVLLTNGANISACTFDGFSPLFIDCQNGHEETVRALVEYGANNQCTYKKGTSPEQDFKTDINENILQLL